MDTFNDKTLNCADCGGEFLFSKNEQAFYAERGFTNEPKRCKNCRDKRKTAREGNGGSRERQMVSVTCDSCGIATEVPFTPVILLPQPAPTMLKATKRIQVKARPTHTETVQRGELAFVSFRKGAISQVSSFHPTRGGEVAAPRQRSHAAAHDQPLRTRRSEFHGYVQR